MKVVQFANEVLDMHEELYELRREVARLRSVEQEYRQYVQESLHHGQQMMVNWLDLLTSKKVKILPLESEVKP